MWARVCVCALCACVRVCLSVCARAKKKSEGEGGRHAGPGPLRVGGGVHHQYEQARVVHTLVRDPHECKVMCWANARRALMRVGPGSGGPQCFSFSSVGGLPSESAVGPVFLFLPASSTPTYRHTHKEGCVRRVPYRWYSRAITRPMSRSRNRDKRSCDKLTRRHDKESTPIQLQPDHTLCNTHTQPVGALRSHLVRAAGHTQEVQRLFQSTDFRLTKWTSKKKLSW